VGSLLEFAGTCVNLTTGELDRYGAYSFCRGGSADGTAREARFNQPWGPAYDFKDDIIFVADSGNNEIRGIRSDGSVFTLAGRCVRITNNPNCIGMLADGKGAAARFFYPTGITYDNTDDALYVVDRFNHAIRKVKLDGQVSTVAGNGKAGYTNGVGSAARFCFPRSIAYVPYLDALLVTETHNLAIRKATTDGTVTTWHGDKLPSPNPIPAETCSF